MRTSELIHRQPVGGRSEINCHAKHPSLGAPSRALTQPPSRRKPRSTSRRRFNCSSGSQGAMIASPRLVVTHLTGADSACRAGALNDIATGRTALGDIVAAVVRGLAHLQPLLRVGRCTRRPDRFDVAGDSGRHRPGLTSHRFAAPHIYLWQTLGTTLCTRCCGARSHGAGLTT